MKKNIIIWSAVGVVIAALAAAIIYLNQSLKNEKIENEELMQLAEINKQEMENQYKQFDVQYGELQKQLTNDSLMAQIDIERRHTQELLEELRRTKATDVAEITRLKKEIETLRGILRSYIVQVDSLNRLNEALTAENTTIKKQYDEAATQITSLSEERNKLKDKVDIAAQLDATKFWVQTRNKRNKEAKKVKDVRSIAFGFTITKNVTAQNGQRIIYARILKPDNSVLTNSNATFQYENTELTYSIKKYIEYNGEEQDVTLYWDVNEYLSAGTYKIFIFADTRMIGQTSFELK
ncbi:MAG: hypothetical protein IKP43_10560 [Bacteroidaceae bacterium]|jgi:hypothetical protein|nr:hypothetical protein [Bacteroidaceae bacterium]